MDAWKTTRVARFPIRAPCEKVEKQWRFFANTKVLNCAVGGSFQIDIWTPIFM